MSYELKVGSLPRPFQLHCGKNNLNRMKYIWKEKHKSGFSSSFYVTEKTHLVTSPFWSVGSNCRTGALDCPWSVTRTERKDVPKCFANFVGIATENLMSPLGSLSDETLTQSIDGLPGAISVYIVIANAVDPRAANARIVNNRGNFIRRFCTFSPKSLGFWQPATSMEGAGGGTSAVKNSAICPIKSTLQHGRSKMH
jgi:hypothetical protein